jgi:hypothetical protein
VWPLCLAIGGLLAYELLLFSDAFITLAGSIPAWHWDELWFRRSPLRCSHWQRRAIANGGSISTYPAKSSCTQLLCWQASASSSPSPSWQWCCRVRRQLGLVLQLAMLFGSIVVLATVLSSGSLRRRLRFLISRNFFTHRYDYRVEWLKFMELVSGADQAEELQVRIIEPSPDLSTARRGPHGP